MTGTRAERAAAGDVFALLRAPGFARAWLSAVCFALGVWIERLAIGWFVLDATSLGIRDCSAAKHSRPAMCRAERGRRTEPSGSGRIRALRHKTLFPRSEGTAQPRPGRALLTARAPISLPGHHRGAARAIPAACRGTRA